MNKNHYETISLSVGKMRVYDFGEIKLHAYETGDPIDDEVFILERNGQAVILESPCFFDSEKALTEYLAQRKLTVAALLPAYHMAGAAFLPQVSKYATANAEEYGHQGGGKTLIDNFAQVFGEAFDKGIHTVTHLLQPGPVTLGGIELVIVPTPDAFDVEIPAINAVYTHMLGHDCHSIVAGAAHADAIIAQLEGYLERGYTLILTSHYVPEDLKDVETKIAYLKNLKAIAARSADAESFQAAVRESFPGYSGDNYLEMTAGLFFA